MAIAGFTLTPNGYSISSDITEATLRFPTPSSRTDLRSFFGLTNQLASSTNNIAKVLAPLRSLLSPRNDFLWTQTHEEVFIRAKEALVVTPTLAYFDATKDTYLHTDASTLGIGFVLLQKTKDGDEEPRMIQASSRFLTDTESRYAVIELECLAVAWAVKKCNIFPSGTDHFTVLTDHSPLVPILNTNRLDEIENPRLRRLRTRLMAYIFTAQWLKGTKNEAADALSRHPYQSPVQGDDLAEHDVNTDTSQVVTSQAPSISEIRASTMDPLEHENLHLQKLRRHDWHSCSDTEPNLQDVGHIWNHYRHRTPSTILHQDPEWPRSRQKQTFPAQKKPSLGGGTDWESWPNTPSATRTTNKSSRRT